MDNIYERTSCENREYLDNEACIEKRRHEEMESGREADLFEVLDHMRYPHFPTDSPEREEEQEAA